MTDQMTDDTAGLLRKIAAEQARAANSLTFIESRIAMIREEVKEAASLVRRMKLAQENEKSFARSQGEAVKTIDEKLIAIATLLSPPPKT